MLRRPRTSSLFPYTTLFRSFLVHLGTAHLEHGADRHALALLIHALMENRSEEHTSELQSPMYLVCRLLLEKKKLDPQRTASTMDSWVSITTVRVPAASLSSV